MWSDWLVGHYDFPHCHLKICISLQGCQGKKELDAEGGGYINLTFSMIGIGQFINTIISIINHK